jgi:hypothetical protein
MNPPSADDRCDISIDDDTPTVGLFEVHFQFSDFRLTLTATDLSFLQRILDFVAETKGNPEYRDLCLGGGHYRCMPEKSIDLSGSFRDSKFVLQKDGEYDDAYIVRVECLTGLRVGFDLRGKRLDEFIESLHDML